MFFAKTLNNPKCIKLTNKIPEYIREYKREYQFIRGLNKKIEYFVFYNFESRYKLFDNYRVDIIKNLMKRILRAQEKGKLKDFREIEFCADDVLNLIRMEKNVYKYNINIDHFREFNDDQDPNNYFKNFYDDIKIFFSKLNINGIDDIDNIDLLTNSFLEIYMEDFGLLVNSNSDDDL